MSIRFGRTTDTRNRTPSAGHGRAFDDAVVVARDLTPEEMNAIVARFEAEAAAARRRTWRRRTNIRTSVFRPTSRKPQGRRP